MVEMLINITAGFDETSHLLEERFHDCELSILDFYDPSKHTEISIQRARNALPPHPKTQEIKTSRLPFEAQSVNKVFLILSAHEIRNPTERTEFFRELNRILKLGGRIVLTEHLRDIPNYFAYNIGALHFHSESTWRENFRDAELKISKRFNITPFITTFILEKNGNSSQNIGLILIVLAVIHVIFPRYFDWAKNLASLSLINREMMYVHTLFVALIILLMGILCITSSKQIVETNLGKRLALGFAIFWFCRLLIQVFGYSSKLWRGKAFETSVHIVFSLLWTYFSLIFFLGYWL